MQEYTKASLKLMKTPEFQAYLETNIAEANNNISHRDFVAGVKSGTMGFKCMLCAPHQLIRGVRGIIFSGFVFLYVFAPFIFISLWAWRARNPWLLVGIITSGLGSRIAAHLIYNEQKQYSIGAFLLIASVVSWLCFGIHSYYTFFVLCALWGLMFFMIAHNAEKEYAMQSLVENPEVFEDAVKRNKIMIVRKDAAE
jgi:hypothetical protein